MFGATGITPLHMPAERFGAAGLDSMHDFQMDGGQLVVLPVTLSMKTKNVGKFRVRSCGCRRPARGGHRR